MKITGAQKMVTVKDWRSPWKILDEGKGDPLFGRMSRCLEEKSRGWGRVGRGHLREGTACTKAHRGEEAG